MLTPHYEDGQVTLYHGDCIEVIRALPDNSVHAVVTDPPYGLEFMGKGWDGADGFRRSLNAADAGRPNAFGRASRTSPEYKAGRLFGEWCEVWAAEAFRVLKPGGHIMAFGGTRTWHRLAVAVEDAGFDIRDSIAWLYGSGFPKSMNLDGEWVGWGTALKPAFEPIVVGRKPLAGTVAANLLAHSAGALNIDATRIATTDALGGGQVSSKESGWDRPWKHDETQVAAVLERGKANVVRAEDLGRWPTNVLLDDSQAESLDGQTGILTSGANPTKRGSDKFRTAYSEFKGQQDIEPARGANSGGASRFFPTFHYEAKAPGAERPNVEGLQHPTVKPLELMRWLVRLVASPGAIILEPFAGSGTTLEACLIEGFNVIGIEQESEYLPLIMQRISKPLQQSLFSDLV